MNYATSLFADFGELNEALFVVLCNLPQRLIGTAKSWLNFSYVRNFIAKDSFACRNHAQSFIG